MWLKFCDTPAGIDKKTKVWCTLKFQIAIGVHLLIFESFFTPYACIRDPMLICFWKIERKLQNSWVKFVQNMKSFALDLEDKV